MDQYIHSIYEVIWCSPHIIYIMVHRHMIWRRIVILWTKYERKKSLSLLGMGSTGKNKSHSYFSGNHWCSYNERPTSSEYMNKFPCWCDGFLVFDNDRRMNLTDFGSHMWDHGEVILDFLVKNCFICRISATSGNIDIKLHRKTLVMTWGCPSSIFASSSRYRVETSHEHWSCSRILVLKLNPCGSHFRFFPRKITKFIIFGNTWRY